jgi:hypothetical protein
MLHKKHWEHHGYTGTHDDPDFHSGNSALLPWFCRCAGARARMF